MTIFNIVLTSEYSLPFHLSCFSFFCSEGFLFFWESIYHVYLVVSGAVQLVHRTHSTVLNVSQLARVSVLYLIHVGGVQHRGRGEWGGGGEGDGRLSITPSDSV